LSGGIVGPLNPLSIFIFGFPSTGSKLFLSWPKGKYYFKKLIPGPNKPIKDFLVFHGSVVFFVISIYKKNLQGLDLRGLRDIRKKFFKFF